MNIDPKVEMTANKQVLNCLIVDDESIAREGMNILYAESMQNYVKLHFKEKTLTIYQTMKTIEEMLSSEAFFRIHKSYLINICHIDLITGNRLFIDGQERPISRQRKDDLLTTVVYKNLISK